MRMGNLFTFDFSNVEGSSSFDDNTKLKQKKYDVITKFGRTVFWLDKRHYQTDELEKHRMVGDEEVDRLLEAIRQTYFENESKSSSAFSKSVASSFRFFDVIDSCSKLYQRKSTETLFDGDKPIDTERLMIQFYDKYYNHVPEWTDWDQIQRGIDVFVTYAPAMGLSLYYLSLVSLILWLHLL